MSEMSKTVYRPDRAPGVSLAYFFLIWATVAIGCWLFGGIFITAVLVGTGDWLGFGLPNGFAVIGVGLGWAPAAGEAFGPTLAEQVSQKTERKSA